MTNDQPASHDIYENLALQLWLQYTSNPLTKVKQSPVISSIQQKRLKENPGLIRASLFFKILDDQGISLVNIRHALFYPQKKQTEFMTANSKLITANLIMPSLRYLRKNLTIKQMATKLGLSNSSAWHHWEMGRREIPLYTFLKVLSFNPEKFKLFLETLNFKNPFELPETVKYTPGGLKKLFKKPWLPTLLFLVQATHHQKKAQDTEKFAKILNVSKNEVFEGIQLLLDWGLLIQENKSYRALPAHFQTPPLMKDEYILQMKKYWFDKGYDLSRLPGHHSITAFCISQSSKVKILNWIQELEAKICDEIEGSKPETVLFLKLQAADLLSHDE